MDKGTTLQANGKSNLNSNQYTTLKYKMRGIQQVF